MKKYKAESNVMPNPIDMHSSPTSVYLNDNVKEMEIEDPETQEKSVVYKYDVTEMTKDEYVLIKCEKVESDNVYVAMMLGVEVDE